MLFNVSDNLFAVDSSFIVSVESAHKFSIVDDHRKKDFVEGVANIRDKITPIWQLSKLLFSTESSSPIILILKYQAEEIGMLISNIGSMIEVDDDKIQYALSQQVLLLKDNRLVNILDVPQIFSQKD